MNAYVLVHESYSYYDNEYGTEIEIFETLDSAKVYFEMIKANIIQEYLDHAELSNINILLENDYFYMDEEPTAQGDIYFFVDYEEYGNDRLRIYEKPIMKFNLEEC